MELSKAYFFRLVSSSPIKQSPQSADLRRRLVLMNYWSKRKVPNAPNPLHNPVLKNYWSKRKVVEAPNSKHNSMTPISINYKDKKYLGFRKFGGSSNIYDLLRLVPSGPNGAESPGKLPANAHGVGN
ncbi:unnamed protein product [Prunus armeniaca]